MDLQCSGYLLTYPSLIRPPSSAHMGLPVRLRSNQAMYDVFMSRHRQATHVIRLNYSAGPVSCCCATDCTANMCHLMRLRFLCNACVLPVLLVPPTHTHHAPNQPSLDGWWLECMGLSTGGREHASHRVGLPLAVCKSVNTVWFPRRWRIAGCVVCS